MATKGLSLFIIFIGSLAWGEAFSNKEALQELLKKCEANQGCTYSLIQEKELTGESAYVLSTFKKFEKKYSRLSPEIVKNYVQNHSKDLKKAGRALGVWLDNKIYYLDVVSLLPKRPQLKEEDVMACAKKFQQQAVYDLEKKVVISLEDKKAQRGHCPLGK